MTEMQRPKEPFATQNRALALALITAGCKLVEQSEGGPALNLYTLAFLRSRRIGVGKSIEEAVKEAVERKIPGIVTYLFERTATLELALALWMEMEKEEAAAKAEDRQPILPEVSMSAIIQTLFVHSRNQRDASELPWFNNPFIAVTSSTTKAVEIPGKPGSKSITTGRGKVWQLGASEETKSHLGV